MRCVVISLEDEGVQRRELLEMWTQSVFGEKVVVSYHLPRKHPVSSQHGAFHSVFEVIEKAYNDGEKHLMLFEDIVKPTEHCDMDKLFEYVHKLDSTVPSWEVLYLGHFLIQVLDKVFPGVVEGFCIATHAIVLSRQGMKHLLMELPKYWGIPDIVKPIDMAIIEILKNSRKVTFATVPVMFSQTGHDMIHQSFEQDVVKHFDQKEKESVQIHKQLYEGS